MTDIRLPVHQELAVDAGPHHGLGDNQSDGVNVTEFRKAPIARCWCAGR